jgi:plasmid stabilization system protein ParE
LRNRDKAPEAFDEEIERGFLLLLDRPHLGHRVRTKRRGGARVIHLDRIRYDLYYEVRDAVVIQESIAEIERGEGIPAEEVLAELNAAMEEVERGDFGRSLDEILAEFRARK